MVMLGDGAVVGLEAVEAVEAVEAEGDIMISIVTDMPSPEMIIDVELAPPADTPVGPVPPSVSGVGAAVISGTAFCTVGAWGVAAGWMVALMTDAVLGTAFFTPSQTL